MHVFHYFTPSRVSAVETFCPFPLKLMSFALRLHRPYAALRGLVRRDYTSFHSLFGITASLSRCTPYRTHPAIATTNSNGGSNPPSSHPPLPPALCNAP